MYLKKHFIPKTLYSKNETSFILEFFKIFLTFLYYIRILQNVFP